MQKGLRCSGSIPYGYKRTKDDKQQLYVDEPAAEAVSYTHLDVYKRQPIFISADW